jgi:AraC-like DNA-binding protein
VSLIEAGVRGGALALLVALAALLLRDGRASRAGRWAALFALAAAADLIGSAPALDGVHALWLAPLRLLAAGLAAIFWVTVSALFDDDFELGWLHAGLWLALLGLGVFSSFAPVAWRGVPHDGLALICLGLALWTVLAGRSGDLDEARRRLRLVFAGSVGLFTAAIIGLRSLGTVGGGRSDIVSGVDAAGNLALALFFVLALTSLTPGAFLAPLALPRNARPTGAAPAALRAEPEDPRDAALLADLQRKLESERAWRDEQLTIGQLASRLGVPEYRLRRVINQRLGHRNFAAFLNGYRLDEAMAALADPAQAEVPILTIALDAGFASIGPFNRAFKARAEETPSEFRRRSLAERRGG